MTGLDAEKCHLLEVACIITDDQLNIVAKVCCDSLYFVLVINVFLFS